MTERSACVITGGASGIGRATALRMCAMGVDVVTMDLAEPRADDELTPGAAAQTNSAGAPDAARDAARGALLHQVGDVCSEADNAAAVRLAEERFGRVDRLVLNAGLPVGGTLEALDLTEFGRALDVNLRGVLLGLRAGVPALRRAGGGAVVVTASLSGLGADPGLVAYNAAKGGVLNLVRSAAFELAAEGIRVNAVCPGPIRTPMTEPTMQADPAWAAGLRRAIPLGRFGEAHEVAAAIEFLAGPHASFITGALLPVDGGIRAGSGQFLPPQGAGA